MQLRLSKSVQQLCEDYIQVRVQLYFPSARVELGPFWPPLDCEVSNTDSRSLASMLWLQNSYRAKVDDYVLGGHDHCKQTKSQSSLRCAMLQISTKSRRASGKHKGAAKSFVRLLCYRSRARRCPLFFSCDLSFRVGASCGYRLAGGAPVFSKIALTLILKILLFTLQPVVSSIGIALAESEIIFKY